MTDCQELPELAAFRAARDSLHTAEAGFAADPPSAVFDRLNEHVLPLTGPYLLGECDDLPAAEREEKRLAACAAYRHQVETIAAQRARYAALVALRCEYQSAAVWLAEAVAGGVV